MSCPITRTYEINEDDQNIFTPTAAIYDYIYRPKELEIYNLYDFVHCFEKVDKKNKPDFLFSGPWHPQFKTHGVKRRCQPVVPRIIGPRMPDKNIKEEKLVELYSKIALLLYHPFRDPAQEFINNNQSCTLFFRNWQPSSAILKRLDYHQQYHLSMADDKIYREEQKERELELQSKDCDIITRNEENEELTHRVNSTNVDPLYNQIIHGIVPFDDILDQQFVDKEIDTISQVTFSDDPTNSSFPSYIDHDSILPSSAVTKNDLKKHALNCYQSYSFDACDELHKTDSDVIKNLHLSQNRQILLKNINEALQLSERVSNCKNFENIENKMYPSFNEVSNHFKLNAKQHQAFVLFSIPIFVRIFGLTIEDIPKLFTTMSPSFY